MNDLNPDNESAPAMKRIKSYVLRQGRMTESQKIHYEKTFPVYGIDCAAGLLDRLALMPDKHRIVLEIGFGNGEPTVHFAMNNPDTGYVAVEVHTPGVGRLLRRIEEEKITNIRVVHSDVIEFLNNNVPDRFFDGVHIFFPDPWPKKKHNKRRLFNMSFLHLLWNKTSSGAYIRFISDWHDYAETALQISSQATTWSNPYNGFAPADPARPLTAFEAKGLKKNHGIYEVFLKRNDS